MNIDRRELLTTFLGLPLGLAGCAAWNSTKAATPPGELVGASFSIGHKIRDGVRLEVPEEKWEHHPIVIIGAGIAGLSAARRLHQNGLQDFRILELEPEPGGTSRFGARSDAVVQYPWGAHYLPLPTKENPDLVRLLEEMGVLEGRDDEGNPIAGEQFLCRDPQERLYFEGKWSEGLFPHEGATRSDENQLREFQAEINRWADWRDSQGRRAFALPRAYGSDDAEVTALNKLSMAEWMTKRGWDSQRLRWWVDYACRDDYGLKLEETNAWAGVFYFVSRKSKSGQSTQPFLSWPEGNGRFVKHLTGMFPDRIASGWAVADVNPTEHNGSPLVEIIAIDSHNQVRGFRAERVIFAAPQFLARYVIRPYRENPPSHLGSFQYGSWIVANLILKDRPRETGFPLCWDNVFYNSPSLGYVAATHQRGLDYGPTVLTWYYPICEDTPERSRSRALSLGREDWAEIALTDIGQAHPEIRELTERLDVMRWGHAMVRAVPGFSWSQDREVAARPFRGIHFAHSDLSGLALFEEAFYQGNRAADEIRAALQTST